MPLILTVPLASTPNVESFAIAITASLAIELPFLIVKVVLLAVLPTFTLVPLPETTNLAVSSISFEVNQFNVPPVIVDSPPKNLPLFTFVVP